MAEESGRQEKYIDERWDAAIDLSLRRVVYGSLAGGAVALLLFRGAGARAAAVAFGAGFGSGMACQESQELLRGTKS